VTRKRVAATKSDCTSRISCTRSVIVPIAKPEASSTFAAASVLSLFKIATALTSDPARSAALNAIVSGERHPLSSAITGGETSRVASSAVAPNMSICICTLETNVYETMITDSANGRLTAI